MGFFGSKDKVTSKNAMDKAEEKLKATKAVGYKAGNKDRFEDEHYGDKYMADVYVDVKNDDNVTMTFQLPDKKAFDSKQAYYNLGGDVLPHGIASMVGKQSMAYFNDLSATSLSFQKVGWRKGAVEEPSTKALKGGQIYNFRSRYIDMATLRTEFGDVLQEMAYTKAIPQDVRTKAVKLLAIIAPDMNSEDDFIKNSTPKGKTEEERKASEVKRDRDVKKSGYEAFVEEFEVRAQIGLRCNEQALDIFRVLEVDTKESKYNDLARDILGKALLRMAHDQSVDVENKHRATAAAWCTTLNVGGFLQNVKVDTSSSSKANVKVEASASVNASVGKDAK